MKHNNKHILFRLILAIGVAWGVNFFDLGVVQASEAHRHGSISPFENPKTHTHHTCPLKHAPDCPHKKSHGPLVQIGPDCGGNPLGAIPSGGGFSKEVSMATGLYDSDRALETQKFLTTHSFYLSFISDSFKPPPKSI